MLAAREGRGGRREARATHEPPPPSLRPVEESHALLLPRLPDCAEAVAERGEREGSAWGSWAARMVRAARAADERYARVRAEAAAKRVQPPRSAPASPPASMLPEPPPLVLAEGLDGRALPLQPGAAHGVAMAVGLVRAELLAIARMWRPPEQPRRTGGRQRRAARLRGRSRRLCYVGPAQAAQRFEAAATARGWLAVDGSESEYMSAEEGERP